jgi:hypothetical protein
MLGHFERGPYVQLTTIKYGANGNQLWKASDEAPSFKGDVVQIGGAAVDSANNLYLVATFVAPGEAFITYKYASDGALVWTAAPDNGTGPANGLALDNSTNVILVGQDVYQNTEPSTNSYCTFIKLNASGSTAWTKHYPQPAFGSSAGTSVAVDSGNNSYVTGYSPGTNSSNDIVTIK